MIAVFRRVTKFNARKLNILVINYLNLSCLAQATTVEKPSRQPGEGHEGWDIPVLSLTLMDGSSMNTCAAEQGICTGIIVISVSVLFYLRKRTSKLQSMRRYRMNYGPYRKVHIHSRITFYVMIPVLAHPRAHTIHIVPSTCRLIVFEFVE